MHFKFLSTICDLSDDKKIVSLSWSPNNRKLAAATSDRQILLFDENGERRDKFATKPGTSGSNRKSYVIKAVAFSPDSIKLAVAQSDNFVFVYHLGEDWEQKKAINNKFSQSSPVLSMVWLQAGPIICGLLDGKVRALQTKSNSSHSLYAADSAVISLSSNMDGTGFLSGHIDGSVIRCYVVERDDNTPAGKVLIHSVPPFALAWCQQNDIIVGGGDRRVVVYNRNGKIAKQIDYSRSSSSPENSAQENDFEIACVSPSGQAVLVGSFNRLRLLVWNSKMSIWEESHSTYIENIYSLESMSWRKDGSKIVCGTVNGKILLFESVLKRSVWKGKLEIIYVGPSQLLIKPLSEGAHNVVIRAQSGQAIDDVKIMGRDNFCVARTKSTLIVANLNSNLISEVSWNNTLQQEKFYFDNSGVCLVFNAGELTLVEYGMNSVLISVRTEFVNPHLISVRINERQSVKLDQQQHQAITGEKKKLAYLIDLKTICMVDLLSGRTIGQVSHEDKIDWLEFNETSRKLLYRDIKQRLMIFDVHTNLKSCIFSGVSFVQWVENSDVAIAQAGQSLIVWYNIDLPERPTITVIQGDVIDVLRENGVTEVLTMDGSVTKSFKLDESLLEFGTAIHDHDYGKAVLFLELIDNAQEAEAMWYNLLSIAQQENNVPLLIRCYAAIGQNAKVFCAQDILQELEQNGGSNSADKELLQKVNSQLSMLNGDLEPAKNYYLERHDIEGLLDLYGSLHKMDEGIA